MSDSSKIFLVFLLVLVTGGVFAYVWYFDGSGLGDDAAALATGDVTVTIPEGTSTAEIAEILEREGVIRSALAFTTAARLDGRPLFAGEYTLPPGAASDVLLDILSVPPSVAVFTVTIPEGLRIDQTLTRIADAQGSPHTVEALEQALELVALPDWVDAEDLPEGANPYEGLLHPNTYEFAVEMPAEDLLARLVGETTAVLERTGAFSDPEWTPYEVLVIASLIEREAKVDEDRPLISSVIHNRTGIGQALQIDATVVYAMGRETGEYPTSLTTADYDFPSPWSTYAHPGLPPTPIAAPGTAAVEAAVNPAQTEFFYYVVEDPATGKHRFSETLAEHQAAIAEIRGN